MLDSYFHVKGGSKFYFFKCKKEDIDIETIAHALSQICRFNGQCKYHYSVAQHCDLVSRICNPKYALWGLLHDAPEAYVGDIISPIKHHLPDFYTFEESVENVVKAKFNLTLTQEEIDDVHHADMQILHLEAKTLLGISPQKEGWHIPPPEKNLSNFKIKKLSPKKAKENYLKRFEELYKAA